jgi:16S rRNA (cytosine1402-N4)-methyltransferase
MAEGGYRHVPVLLREVVELLDARPGATVVDATVGEGGHAEAILERMGGSGCLVGLDRDEEALERSRRRLERFGDAVVLVHSPFSRLLQVLQELGVETVEGVLFDFGVSALQLEVPERGFSFRYPGPLDMRMDRGQALNAWKVVNTYEEGELARIIREYGEERWASRIARRIVLERERAPIDTTDRLAEIVREAIPAPARRRGGHPARRTFQALRIEVNRELDEIRQGLESAWEVLAPRGRMVCIAYHSLEDRLVKGFFAGRAGRCRCPVEERCSCGGQEPARLLTSGALKPSPEEVLANPRARSARLRALERR